MPVSVIFFMVLFVVVVGGIAAFCIGKNRKAQGISQKDVTDQELPKDPVVQQPQPTPANHAGAAPPPQLSTVICPGCGARITLARGSLCDCEYCGTSVHA